MTGARDITELLAELRSGKREALDALTLLLYSELRRLAGRQLQRERAGHSLQPTALVHEAYLRLVNQPDVAWQNRAHFLAVAAIVMRRVLVDHARARAQAKRAVVRVTLDDERVGAANPDLELAALDDALRELAAVDEQLSRVVELRYFGGLTVEETAEALGTSARSVDRAWASARVWLRRHMRDERGP